MSSINKLLNANMYSMIKTLSLRELYPKRMVCLLLEPHLVPTYRYGETGKGMSYRLSRDNLNIGCILSSLINDAM